MRFTVQSGGCKQFVRGETTKSNTTFTFVARGRDGSEPNIMCPADIRQDVVVEEVRPPISDPFTIAATQPNGLDTSAEVRVQ